MKNIKTLLLLFALLVFTQCTKSENSTTQFEGQYIGTLVGEWEKTTIENFNTNPDTSYSSNQYKEENLILTLKNFDFEFVNSNRLNTGTFSVRGDSIFFVDLSLPCPEHIDCGSYLEGGWQYEISKSGLRLTSAYYGWERQNSINKELFKGKRVYELKKVN
ncbi:hypothetical protein [Haliscomenobacter sp.]|uniref:hypothetical protein n=1 Tax=Haliscomenobacter sp. TaxID=2717303 RepID=UPI003BACA93E